MKELIDSPEKYIEQLPDDRKKVIEKLRALVLENLPDGFVEEMSYGMIGYVVPHSKYPAGYHCNPKLPLPFLNIASQKNYISLYYMGLYADKDLMEWFVNEYPKEVNGKPDIGKSCVRFKNADKIPYNLIGQLVSKISADEWISMYEKNFKSNAR